MLLGKGRAFAYVILPLVLMAMISGCGKDSSEDKGAPLQLNMANTSLSLMLRALEQPFLGLLRSGGGDFGAFATSNTQGEADASQLASLKYFISSVEICEGMTPSGTGYSNTTGCVTLYSNRNADYDSYGITAATADTANYLDLMTSEAKSRLNATAKVRAGTYHWGIVSWYKPIKVKASVPYTGGTLYTRAGSMSGSGANQYLLVSSNLNTDPGSGAQEAVVVLNNGGNWFRFQNPLVITDADVDAGTNYVLDLVFNPDRLIKGSVSAASNYTIQDSSQRGIYVPLLDLAPVPRKSTQTTRKETYILSNGALDFDLRLELYSIAEDTANTVYGVDFKVLYKNSIASNILHPQKVSFVTSSGGALEFQNYNKDAMLSGFTRISSGSGTASLNCSNALFGGACTGSVTLTYSAPTVTTL